MDMLTRRLSKMENQRGQVDRRTEIAEEIQLDKVTVGQRDQEFSKQTVESERFKIVQMDNLTSGQKVYCRRHPGG
jgi:hypothetical protein